jgi:CelD/BcsL family acetyltransferase involved in cellulose biosynthesis
MSTIAFLHPDAPAPETVRPKVIPARALTREGVITEIVNFAELIRLKTPWCELVARALEPNVFLEPAFAIPLFQHCANGKDVKFLLIWVQDGPNAQRELIGLVPISKHTFFSCFARSPSHPLAPLGIPLFDRDRGLEALRSLVRWIGKNRPGIKGFIFPYVPKDGATFAVLQRYADEAKEKLQVFKEHKRAVLSKVAGKDGFPKRFISTKRRNNYRQQRRQLSQTGEVTYRTIVNAIELKPAAEAFLSLEFKGWKGLRRTALLAASSETTFFRAMTRLMAIEGKCTIHSLDLDNKPIAMGIVLESGDRDFYWKTTYDERFARYSPGVQMTLELTQHQLASPTASITDSCAIPNHPMMDHIWRERITMADVLLPIHHAHGAVFTIGLWREMAYHSLRDAAKFVVKRIRH